MRNTLLTTQVDLETLSRKLDIAVSVDLLVDLMADADKRVSETAIETYHRRVYRAHGIHTVTVSEDPCTHILSCGWSFTHRSVFGQKRTPPMRYSYMEMHQRLNDVEKNTREVIKNSNQFLKKNNTISEPLNDLYIGFAEPLLDEDEDKTAMRIQSTLAPLKFELESNDCRMVNYLVGNKSGRNNNKRANYYNFYSETKIMEDPVSRNMRPT